MQSVALFFLLQIALCSRLHAFSSKRVRYVDEEWAGAKIFSGGDHRFAYRFRSFPDPLLGKLSSMPVNFTVAYVGDMGLPRYTPAAVRVLELIKRQQADLVLHAGDIDYNHRPQAFEEDVSAILGEAFPYVYAPGDHDRMFFANFSYQQNLAARILRSGVRCHGEVGIHMLCEFKGFLFVISGIGTVARPGHDQWASEIGRLLALARARGAVWLTCTWHLANGSLILSHKETVMDVEGFEACRKHGALIHTGHSHMYSRSHLMKDFVTGTPRSLLGSPLVLAPGATIHVVTGTAGASLHQFAMEYSKRFGTYSHSLLTRYKIPYRKDFLFDFRSDPLQRPLFMKYAEAVDSGANHGAVFCTYNVNGHMERAICRFIDVFGVEHDSFHLVSSLSSSDPTAKRHPLEIGTSRITKGRRMIPPGCIVCSNPTLYQWELTLLNCRINFNKEVLPDHLCVDLGADQPSLVRIRPPESSDFGRSYSFGIVAMNQTSVVLCVHVVSQNTEIEEKDVHEKPQTRSCLPLSVTTDPNVDSTASVFTSRSRQEGIGPSLVEFPDPTSFSPESPPPKTAWRVIPRALPVHQGPASKPIISYLYQSEVIVELGRRNLRVKHAYGWSAISNTLNGRRKLVPVSDSHLYKYTNHSETRLKVVVPSLKVHIRPSSTTTVRATLVSGDRFTPLQRVDFWIRHEKGWSNLKNPVMVPIVSENEAEVQRLNELSRFVPLSQYCRIHSCTPFNNSNSRLTR